MVFNSPCLTDKKELIHMRGINSPCYPTMGWASPEQLVPDLCRSFMCSRHDSSRLDVADKFIFPSSRYVVPTGRVVVPTGRYVVPAGKVIIIVSPGRLSLVPTGRILSPGKVK
ncbi:hypothetical protein Tco_0757568 [Tanacetum coccineum]